MERLITHTLIEVDLISDIQICKILKFSLEIKYF